MKWFFKLFLLTLLSQPLYSRDFETKYQIKNRGVVIGFLTWHLSITDKNYKTSINLKQKGPLSILYSFSGKYEASGKIENGFLYSKKYSQIWKTSKKQRFVEIFYDEKEIKNLTLFPTEKEIPRIDYYKLKNYNDPITSFLNVIFNKSDSYTIDGRRLYVLRPDEKENKIKISIDEYKNIWADHNRNDLKYIDLIIEENLNFPIQINIMFKSSVFKLKKN